MELIFVNHTRDRHAVRIWVAGRKRDLGSISARGELRGDVDIHVHRLPAESKWPVGDCNGEFAITHRSPLREVIHVGPRPGGKFGYPGRELRDRDEHYEND